MADSSSNLPSQPTHESSPSFAKSSMLAFAIVIAGLTAVATVPHASFWNSLNSESR